MKKHTRWLAVLVLLLEIAPFATTTLQAENGKSAGKHNFETWQTIKKLQIDNSIARGINF